MQDSLVFLKLFLMQFDTHSDLELFYLLSFLHDINDAKKTWCPHELKLKGNLQNKVEAASFAFIKTPFAELSLKDIL